jgi:hypothetical protein
MLINKFGNRFHGLIAPEDGGGGENYHINDMTFSCGSGAGKSMHIFANPPCFYRAMFLFTASSIQAHNARLFAYRHPPHIMRF